MGNAILYCAGCNSQLRESDFDKGAAFRSDARAWCKACAPEQVRSMPPPTEKKRLSDSNSMQKVALSSTRRMEVLPAEPPSSRTPLMIGGGVAAVGLITLLLLVGGRSTPRPAAEPPPVAGKDPVPPPPPPPPTRNDKPAEEALRRAREFAQLHADNFTAQLALFDTAVREAEGTGHHSTALRERDAVLARQKEQAKVQLYAIEVAVKAACDREDFAAAHKAIEDARARAMGPDWSADLGARAKMIDDTAEKLFAAVRKDAAEARKRGAEDEVKRLTLRVEKWGIESFRSDLAKAVAAATPKPKPPPPPSKDVDAYRKKWVGAIAIAAGRDYAAALKKIEEAGVGIGDAAVKKEAAADLEIFKTVMAAHDEGLQLLLRTPKGQKSSIAFINEGGTLVELAGTFARIDAGQVDLTHEKGTTQIPVGEIAARSISQALKGKRDGRDLALLCLAEGDAAGAKTFVEAPSTIPDKYWKLVPAAVQAEVEARRLFYAAERESASSAKAVDAAAKFASLLNDRGETAFVKRNRALIAARAEPPKEFFFLFEDLRVGGAFKAFKGEKEEQYWRSLADTVSYVEVLFSAITDAEYKCWVYVGGCCTESVSCTVQVIEGTEPPGEAVPAKQLPSMPFKTHASHEGRGRPTLKWGWAQLSLPKFAAAGVKKVRVLSPLKGFSVGQVLVSATRSAAPGAAELRELERVRTEQRGTGKVDPSLVGHWKFSEGTGTVVADSSPLGQDGKLVNGGTWVPGTASPWSPPSLKLEGRAYVDLGKNLSMLQNASGYTMAAWINADKVSAGENQNKIFSLSKFNGTTPTSDSRASLAIVGGGQLTAGGRSIDADKGQWIKTNDKVIKTGTWVHVAGVVDLAAATIVLYVNGVPQATTGAVTFAAKSTPSTPSTCAAIGSEENEAKWTFEGRISNLRIYSRALSREEVAELAASR